MKNRRQKAKIINDINITPFVDVLLVLLIVFMVAAPMMNGNIEINLPKGTSQNNIQDQDPIIISVQSNNKIYLADKISSSSSLIQDLQKLSNGDSNSRIFIKADRDLNYGFIMEIIKTINEAGFSLVSLITTVEE